MTDPQTDDLGTLDQRDGRWELTFVRHTSHPIEKVWRAVTEPEHLAVWFPTTIEGDRVAGAPLTFTFPFPDVPPMHGELLVWDPFERFEFRWGDEIVAIHLTALADGGCELRLVNRFDEVGTAARGAAGWHACIDRLTCDLDDAEWPWGDDGRWRAVHPLYVERLGPEASVIGPPDWHPEASPESA